jgi:hypothetical protein
MNIKSSFLIRLALISGLALSLIAAIPASASPSRTLTSLASPEGWLAIRLPHPVLLDIIVDPPSGSSTTEAGGAVTISMALNSAPSDDVTIPVASLDLTEGTVSPGSLVFTPANYATPQSITVTGLNDDVDDGNIAYTIQIGPATSTDLNYNGDDPADVDLTNTDNDTAGITVNPTSGLTTTEAGGSDDFTVVLASEPTDTVTIGVTSGDTSEGNATPASLVFDATNWNVAKTVTVTGVNDAIDDGNITFNVNLANPTGGDAIYNAINPADVSVTNNDDADAAGVTVDPTAGLVTTEAAGTDTFTVVLNSEPLASVNIGLSSSTSTEGTVSPASLTFNTANWATEQTVTVTGVNDDIDDGNIAYTIITANPTGSDATYNAINPADVSVTNTDNDTAGITVSAISGPTTEAGGTATFTIVLNTKPTGNVTIGLSSDNANEGTISPASLTFNASDWNTPKTGTVTGVNDDIDDGNTLYNIITANPTGSDPTYNAINPADVPVSNTDDDTFGITVDPTSGLVTTEAAGTDTFSIVLLSQPTEDVTIGITSSTTAEGTVSPASLTFTTANWATPQTVTVTGVDDDSIDGNIAYTITTAAATSADANYNGVDPSDVTATNNDDDVAGITVTPTTGLVTTEAAGTATFTVVLDTLPTADVSLGLSSTDTGEGTVSPATLTFTTANYAAAQTVTVTGVNDDLDDGDIAYTITTAAATSDDPNYTGFNATDVSVTNTDNDTAGITLTPNTGLITSETSTTTTFTVVLTSQPTANVVLALASSDTTEGTISPATMTFTNANWSTTQTATITGVDDKKKDGSIAYTIDVSISSTTDTVYAAVLPVSAGVTNTDDDTPGITVTPTSGLVTTEALGTATFSVVLNTEPNDTVTIGLSSDNEDEGTLAVTEVVFTTTDWNTPQEVIITGVNDDIDDGNIAYNILTAAAVSTDADYDGMDPQDVAVTNNDNDAAGFKFTPNKDLVTTESGGGATLAVSLKSEPTSDVTLNLGSDDVTEGESSPTTLIFTAANWDEPQVVNVVGVDDDQIDGDIAYKIVTDPASSTDPNYDGLNPANITATNQDDDVAKILVNPINGLITSEGGLTATFTVVLDNQPTADVSLTLQSSDTTEGTVSSDPLSFTPDNWATPQTVTVTGKNDNKADGSIIYYILTDPATSADTNYNGIDTDDVEVTNADDDSAGITIAPLTGLITSEGEMAAQISILLNTEPTSDVTFTLASDDTGEGVFFVDNPEQAMTVTFTPENWNAVQTVPLIGVDDLQVDGEVPYTVQVTSSSSDPEYQSKTQELSAVNKDAPSIEWVLPVVPPEFGYYEVLNLDPILMGAASTSDEPITKVRFYRYDPELNLPITLFEDAHEPFQFYLYPEDLDYEFNQIFAYGQGADGIQSRHRRILLFRVRVFNLYLPSVYQK